MREEKTYKGLFPDINLEQAREKAFSIAIKDVNFFSMTEGEKNTYIEKLVDNIINPSKWEDGKVIPFEPDHFIDLLFNWAKGGVSQGRIAIFKKTEKFDDYLIMDKGLNCYMIGKDVSFIIKKGLYKSINVTDIIKTILENPSKETDPSEIGNFISLVNATTDNSDKYAIEMDLSDLRKYPIYEEFFDGLFNLPPFVKNNDEKVQVMVYSEYVFHLVGYKLYLYPVFTSTIEQGLII